MKSTSIPSTPTLSSSTPSTTTRSSRSSTTTLLATSAMTLLLLFYRYAIGLQPHSGQNNHHGAQKAYGGDYEAQRHWMELTWHIPIDQWYYTDLEYWGLDYPPLTAYVSYLCAALSELLVGPQTVAWKTSRGYEDVIYHKPFMRATVLAFDLLLYFTSIYAWSHRLKQQQQQQQPKSSTFFTTNTINHLPLYVFALSQPALVLIDHGHFQYNTTALGLALWSFYFITQRQTKYILCGAVFFSLALSFKQMTLYYAPVVGCYLLGRCCAKPSTFFRSFTLLGLTVITTFTIVWGPILWYSEYPYQALQQIFIRIFPVQRGLFEGKVANIWCALSIRPFRIRQRLSSSNQFKASLLLTVLLMIPACVQVFRVGQQYPIGIQLQQQQQQHKQARILLWATGACALAFFLASFQVHEKSLLLATAPISLLWLESPYLVEWFSYVSMWTMWPLFVLDQLQTAYVASAIIFTSALQLYAELRPIDTLTPYESTSIKSFWFGSLSYMIMIVLHIMEYTITPPASWPDLYPVLWSVIGCAFIGMAYLWTLYILIWKGNYKETTRTVKDKMI